MYKLVNGNLISPPKVWKGIIGYDKDLDRLVKDGWKPLIETGAGELVRYVEHKDHIEKQNYEPEYDYRELRRQAYPEIGDVIDAIFKAMDGDDSELEVIKIKRKLVKESIRKTQDAD